MDHADVLERIEEAVAGPGGLVRLGGDPSVEAAAVREHVASCAMCAAEWRAWSVVSLGLAAAAPDTLEPRAELKDQVLAAAAARPRTSPAAGSPTPAPTDRGISMGPRRPRTPRAPTPAAPRSRPVYQWLLLGAAAAVVLFVAGAVLGGRLTPLGTPTGTSGTAVVSPAVPRGDPGRVLGELAVILQGNGYRLARLETPEGDAGGVVAVSPDGRLAVASSVLAEPPEGQRYICLLDRGGTLSHVGYMRWEPTNGGSLAYWAGDAEPSDLGQPGDVFVVQLDADGAQPALTGEFLG
jgi:hypothetical protein